MPTQLQTEELVFGFELMSSKEPLEPGGFDIWDLKANRANWSVIILFVVLVLLRSTGEEEAAIVGLNLRINVVVVNA